MKDSIARWLSGYQTKVENSPKEKKEEMKNFFEKIKSSFFEFFDDDEMVKAHQAYRSVLSLPQYKHLLPYAGYLEDEGLFLLEGNGFDEKGKGIVTLGFTLELSPQTGADENMERVLQSIYLQAPKGCSISTTLFSTPFVKEPMIERANKYLYDYDLGVFKEVWEKRNNNVYRQAIRERIDFYNNGSFNSPIPSSRGYLFRDYRVIVSVVLPGDVSEPNSIEEAIGFRDVLESTLKSAHLPSFKWNANALLDWVSDMLHHERILNEKHKRVHKTVDDNLPILRDNLSYEGGINTIKSNTIEHNSTNSNLVSMSVTDYPSAPWSLSQMGNMIGDFFQGALAYSCPFMITTYSIVGDGKQFKNKAAMMSARKTQLQSSQSGKFIPGINEEAREWQQAVRSMDDGATMVNMGIKVTLFSPHEGLKKNIAEAKAVWSNKGFTLTQDTFLQALGFKAVLPMGITNTVAEDLFSMGHLSPKFSNNAVALSPMLAEWKGTGTNTITLFGRRGQIMGIDLFDNKQGNYNFAVIAGSGSGKSFLLNEIAFSYLAQGGRVWIIDVGRSYEKLANVLGGEFIEFSEESDICLNPFSFVVDINEELDLLKPLISEMMTGKSATLTPVQMSLLEIAIKDCWDRLGNDTTLTDVRDVFQQDDSNGSVSQDMAKMLYPWTREGTYGKYFDGKANLSFKNPFTVLELEELNAKKPLQTVVLMILMYRITHDMYVNRDGTKSIVIIDEAWSLMGGGEDTSEFIETGYRRARKYGGAFGTATQGVDDYYKNEGATAAYNNADFVFMLRQKKESINMMENDGKIAMDPWKKRTMYDLTTEQGVFSEIYVSYPGGEGVGRLFVDPFSALLYSSRDVDYQAIRSYTEQGLDTSEAITKVLEDRGIK